jgi:thymidine kinase
MEFFRQDGGWIEVICGSMFSGKSEELIRRLRRAQLARQTVQVFKPALDTRYSSHYITSHSDMRIEAKVVESAQELASQILPAATVIGIDEAQFFDLELVEVCNQLANEGKRIIVAGLDQDYLGRPFEPLPQLLAIAEHITKTHAICMKCGNPANYSQRLSASTERVMLGAHEVYEARCRRCFEPQSAKEAVKEILVAKEAAK